MCQGCAPEGSERSFTVEVPPRKVFFWWGPPLDLNFLRCPVGILKTGPERYSSKKKVALPTLECSKWLNYRCTYSTYRRNNVRKHAISLILYYRMAPKGPNHSNFSTAR